MIDPDIEKKVFQHLKKADPLLYGAVLPYCGKVRDRLKNLRTRTALFDALARSIIGQQLSTKAAESIRLRVTALCSGPITPTALSKLSDLQLRTAGLSGAKVKTLRELSSAVMEGSLDLLELKRMTPEVALVRLTSLWGIGPWTAEMFLMFSLGSPDVFSSRDLILARAVTSLHNLPPGTSLMEIERIAARWSPYRTHASLLLWELNDTQ